MKNKQDADAQPREAFLDIETTGLSPYQCDISVVGILTRGAYIGLVSGFDLTPEALCYVLKDVDILYTFNGRRFDIPFVRKKMEMDLEEGKAHIDVLYQCRSVGLRGGQKIVERTLCLSRSQECPDGRAAARLGKRWLKHGDLGALEILMRYNEDDLRNLQKIKEHVERCKNSGETAKDR